MNPHQAAEALVADLADLLAATEAEPPAAKRFARRLSVEMRSAGLTQNPAWHRHIRPTDELELGNPGPP